ncbi:class I SAM-dependent methyltransferase [Streptomyces sp. NBC_01613]
MARQRQEGDGVVGAIRKPRRRSVRWSASNQPRADDGTALGCVVPRRPRALGHWPAAAGNSAFGIRRRIRRIGARCGTGENTLHVASLGWSVLGVDVAETALTIAREKADRRGVEVEFAVADALRLDRLGRSFETVLDCGLFHTFDDDERPEYVASLASVTEHDGTLYVLCFSDDGPDTGPHPVSREKLKAAFDPGSGWNVAAIEPDRIQTRFHDDGAPAWFATIKRI